MVRQKLPAAAVRMEVRKIKPPGRGKVVDRASVEWAKALKLIKRLPDEADYLEQLARLVQARLENRQGGEEQATRPAA